MQLEFRVGLEARISASVILNCVATWVQVLFEDMVVFLPAITQSAAGALWVEFCPKREPGPVVTTGGGAVVTLKFENALIPDRVSKEILSEIRLYSRSAGSDGRFENCGERCRKCSRVGQRSI